MPGDQLWKKHRMKSHQQGNSCSLRRVGIARNAKAEIADDLWTPKKGKSPDQRVLRPSPNKYNNFTNLTRSHKDVFLATKQTGVYKRPNSIQEDRSKKNQNKYYRYQRDVGHTTEECIALKDEIEKLIREGYLQNYVHNRGTKPREDQREAGPPHEIKTIFGRPHFTRETQGAQNRYLREAREGSITTVSSPDQQPAKQTRGEVEDITFSERDMLLVRHPYCDVLVIKVMIANNNVHRILIDNGRTYYISKHLKGWG